MKILLFIVAFLLLYIAVFKFATVKEAAKAEAIDKPNTIFDFFPELRSKVDSVIFISHSTKIKIVGYKELGRDYLFATKDRVYLHKIDKEK